VPLASLCSRRDPAPKGLRNCYLLQVGTWRRHRYSRSPSMIDREQRGLKWVLPMMKAGREPVLRHEIDDFIPQRGDDCVPWNGTKTLNQSALTIREMPKPTAQKAVRVTCNFEQDRNNARCAGTVTVVVSAKICDERSRRVRSRTRASMQTRISSSWVPAYESKSGAVISRSRQYNHLP